MKVIFCVYCIMVTYLTSCNGNFLSKFQICSRSDPNMNKCLKEAIQNALRVLKNGLPEYNYPSMDPIKMKDWAVQPSAVFNFLQQFQNIELFNHTDARIREVEVKIMDSRFFLNIKYTAPTITISTDYNYTHAIINGVDYTSNGRAVYMIVNYRGDLSMVGKIGENGFLFITKSQLSIEGDTFYSVYNTTNEELSKTINSFIDTHRLLIYPHVMKKFGDLYAHVYKDLANIIFSQILFDDIFPA
ncbi:hypothetical protein RI129_012931 [Pyrocoelia pectoralis]|uniref:Uncharacterized protein n=1 Tax=Pyrocoelia pectoralis TaxID=417401 RepID=A0AAN7V3W7_9COLE